MSATAVREKRQITLPQDVFEAAGLEIGDQVDWQIDGGDIRGRKLVTKVVEELDVDDVDPTTLLPKVGRITAESLIKSIREGRERHQ
jgi:bifunctional DNA-binding transcriptional regulator/antitoxin component of YhaV-PrlF toxin-antitoxin module